MFTHESNENSSLGVGRCAGRSARARADNGLGAGSLRRRRRAVRHCRRRVFSGLRRQVERQRDERDGVRRPILHCRFLRHGIRCLGRSREARASLWAMARTSSPRADLVRSQSVSRPALPALSRSRSDFSRTPRAAARLRWARAQALRTTIRLRSARTRVATANNQVNVGGRTRERRCRRAIAAGSSDAINGRPDQHDLGQPGRDGRDSRPTQSRPTPTI